MPRNARVVAPGIPYHVTQRGTNRQPVFFRLSDRKLYLQLIRENQSAAGVRVIAYSLMSNHVHFVIVPEREESLAILFGRANGRYAQAVNIRLGRCGHLWQARYHSCPMEGAHLWMGIRYVEENPCRAGIVARAEDYRWSSAAAHLRGDGDKSGILDMGYWEQAGGAATLGGVVWATNGGRRCDGLTEVHVCGASVWERRVCQGDGGAISAAVVEEGGAPGARQIGVESERVSPILNLDVWLLRSLLGIESPKVCIRPEDLLHEL